MPPGPGDLHALAVELLTASAAGLDTLPGLLGAPFVGAPSRQYVSPGVPVADACEMLVVHVQQINEGDRSRDVFTATSWINRPVWFVTVLRCTPQGTGELGKNYKPPTVTALNANSSQLDADAWALWNHLHNEAAAGRLFETCGDCLIGPMLSQAPSGTSAGWTLQVSAKLDGYQVLGT